MMAATLAGPFGELQRVAAEGRAESVSWRWRCDSARGMTSSRASPRLWPAVSASCAPALERRHQCRPLARAMPESASAGIWTSFGSILHDHRPATTTDHGLSSRVSFGQFAASLVLGFLSILLPLVIFISMVGACVYVARWWIDREAEGPRFARLCVEDQRSSASNNAANAMSRQRPRQSDVVSALRRTVEYIMTRSSRPFSSSDCFITFLPAMTSRIPSSK